MNTIVNLPPWGKNCENICLKESSSTIPEGHSCNKKHTKCIIFNIQIREERGRKRWANREGGKWGKEIWNRKWNFLPITAGFLGVRMGAFRYYSAITFYYNPLNENEKKSEVMYRSKSGWLKKSKQKRGIFGLQPKEVINYWITWFSDKYL